MFSDEILEKIFAIKELQKLALEDQSNIIHAIERIWEEDYAVQLQSGKSRASTDLS